MLPKWQSGNYYRKKRRKRITSLRRRKCDFEDYDALLLMSETAKIRRLITKRGTLEILIPLCCSTNPVRYKKFRQAMKGFSTRTLTNRLDGLRKNGIVERKRYNEIPPRVEYRLTTKGQRSMILDGAEPYAYQN